MATYDEFLAAAPRVGSVFRRRHAATGRLCFLGTLKADGSPRICPMEPYPFEGELWLVGMPGTRKFADLGRDPRFTLHTATTDTHVGDGDAKLWGTVRDVQDRDRQRRWAEALYEESGFDLRGEHFAPFYAADLLGASAVEVADGHLDVTVWTAGGEEVVNRKH